MRRRWSRAPGRVSFWPICGSLPQVPAVCWQPVRCGPAGYEAVFWTWPGWRPSGIRFSWWQLAVREARLRGAGLVAGPLAAVADRPAVLEALHAEPQPVLLIGDGAWDPAWTTRPPLLVDVPVSTSAERSDLWRTALGAARRGWTSQAATISVPAASGAGGPGSRIRPGAGHPDCRRPHHRVASRRRGTGRKRIGPRPAGPAGGAGGGLG